MKVIEIKELEKIYNESEVEDPFLTGIFKHNLLHTSQVAFEFKGLIIALCKSMGITRA